MVMKPQPGSTAVAAAEEPKTTQRVASCYGGRWLLGGWGGWGASASSCFAGLDHSIVVFLMTSQSLLKALLIHSIKIEFQECRPYMCIASTLLLVPNHFLESIMCTCSA